MIAFQTEVSGSTLTEINDAAKAACDAFFDGWAYGSIYYDIEPMEYQVEMVTGPVVVSYRATVSVTEVWKS